MTAYDHDPDLIADLWHSHILAADHGWGARARTEIEHRHCRRAAIAASRAEPGYDPWARDDRTDAEVAAELLYGDDYDDESAPADGSDPASGHVSELWLETEDFYPYVIITNHPDKPRMPVLGAGKEDRAQAVKDARAWLAAHRPPRGQDYITVYDVDQTGTQIKVTTTRVVKAPEPKAVPCAYCRLCDRELPLRHGVCELYPRNPPDNCECSGCQPRKRSGTQRYCPGECERRGENVADRIRRVRRGGTPRITGDAVADAIVFRAMEWIYRARASRLTPIVDHHKPGIWIIPVPSYRPQCDWIVIRLGKVWRIENVT